VGNRVLNVSLKELNFVKLNLPVTGMQNMFIFVFLAAQTSLS